MTRINMPTLAISGLTALLPIVQGGMAVGISLSGMASAVANAGGVGVIAATGIGMMEVDYIQNFRAANKRALRKEIARARSMSRGIIGVNIMVALSDFEDLTLVATKEGADILFLGAGLPIKGLPMDEIIKHNTKVIPIVSSGRAAKIIFSSWQKSFGRIPDGVVVEGPKAGGHLGFKKENLFDPSYALPKLVADVLKELEPFSQRAGYKIPVIAGGGIYTGEDIYRMLELGASGVQMATRFVTTVECDASPEFKQAYLDCTEEDLTIIESPVGLPGRAIKNSFLKQVANGERHPFRCPWKCLSTCDYTKAPYCIALGLKNAMLGRLDQGFAFAGANAWRTDKIVTVAELVNELQNEYDQAVRADSNKDKNLMSNMPTVLTAGMS
jgi:nitronate monooxygenase